MIVDNCVCVSIKVVVGVCGGGWGGGEGGGNLCSSISGKTFKIIAFHTLKDKISRIKQENVNTINTYICILMDVIL
jgi:hypothetical protein